MKRELTDDQLKGYENDIFLTSEVLEETINSIIGTYARMSYFEQARGESKSGHRITTYSDLRAKYRALKLELTSKDLEQKIPFIGKLNIELYDVLELEKLIYSNEKGYPEE